MSKTTSWANRTKSDLAAVGAEELAALRPVGRNADFEPINTYYQFTARKDGTVGEKARVLTKGTKIFGTFEGSFTKTQNNKFKKPTHKIRTAEGLVALPSSGQLDKLIAQVEEGAKILVTYNGKQEIKRGTYAGSLAHTFDVASDRQKSE